MGRDAKLNSEPEPEPESEPEPEWEGEALVREASRGDDAAVDTLLGQHLPGLRAFVRLRCGPVLRAKESSSDLVQSVCREVLEHAERFQFGGETGFRHWLYTTALRKISHRHEFWKAKKRDVRRERNIPGSAGNDRDESLALQYASVASPSRVAMAREESERIEKAFDRLPDAYREVIVMARITGLSRVEMAQRMGRSEGAVRTLLSRALSLLAEKLEVNP